VIITQGEDSDITYVNRIAAYKFELPPGRPAKCPIKVTYSYDVNQRMHCKFEDLESHKVLEVDLSLGRDDKICMDDTGNMKEQMSAVEDTIVE
jgi:hypothetical protein